MEKMPKRDPDTETSNDVALCDDNHVSLPLAHLPDRAGEAIQLLVQARRYADDLQCCKWEFSLSQEWLEQARLNANDLCWLVRKGLVDHILETTTPDADVRSFERTRSTVFRDKSRFVLSDTGLQLLTRTSTRLYRVDRPQVRWDATAHCLMVNGQTVKEYKLPSPNQERILSAFEEEGWPSRIDDPLPLSREIHPKRRLNDTIKGLNRNQRRELIRFRGDGSGQGVIWEPVH